MVVPVGFEAVELRVFPGVILPVQFRADLVFRQRHGVVFEVDRQRVIVDVRSLQMDRRAAVERFFHRVHVLLFQVFLPGHVLVDDGLDRFFLCFCIGFFVDIPVRGGQVLKAPDVVFEDPLKGGRRGKALTAFRRVVRKVLART